MSRLGAGPNTQLFCMGPSPPAGPEEWGGWGQQGNAALRKGALLLEGTQPGGQQGWQGQTRGQRGSPQVGEETQNSQLGHRESIAMWGAAPGHGGEGNHSTVGCV